MSRRADGVDEAVLLRAVVADIAPAALRTRILHHLKDDAVSTGPVVRQAAVMAGGAVSTDELDRRVVGVQLIADGLSLLQGLSRDPPWDHGRKSGADLDLLAAEVMVAKGFSMLADTAAAQQAVTTIHNLAMHESVLAEPDARVRSVPNTLAADLIELGVTAGITASDSPPSAPGDFDVCDTTPICVDGIRRINLDDLVVSADEMACSDRMSHSADGSAPSNGR